MINLEAYRTEKETVYFWLSAILGGLIWIGVILFTIGVIFTIHLLTFKFTISLWYIVGFWALVLLIILFYWITRELFKAKIFGNSIQVNESQHPDIYKASLEISRELGLMDLPYIFVVNSDGVINALALRFIGHAYVILNGALVDLMLKRNAVKELRMALGHELAHHAAGHVSILKELLIWPAIFVPFLRKAYRRACELTADRIAMMVTGDLEAATRALTSLASGSEALAGKTDIHVFIRQEQDFFLFFAFLREIFSTHPRITKRVILLARFAQMLGIPQKGEALGQWLLYGVAGPLAGKSIELDQGQLLIGRDARVCNLVIPGDSSHISKQHCRLRYDAGSRVFFLEDLESTNGTFLASGQRLTSGNPQPLRPGERFYLSDAAVTFELRFA